jgi:predicted thioesterase
MDVGAHAAVTLTVTPADTAVAFGSGEVEVLATPRVLALVEEATVHAVRDLLEAGQTTVGTSVSLEHLAATLVGHTVTAQARLDEVDGRRLTFSVSVREGETELARGRIDRVVVDRQRFLDRAGRVAA